MLTPDHLKAIKRRAERASKGPWEVEGKAFSRTIRAVRVKRKGFSFNRGGVAVIVSDYEYEDGEFIAHARTDLPALLAEVERWWAFRDRLRILLLRWRCEADGMPGLLQHSAGEIEALLAEMGLAGTEEGGERDQGEGAASC